MKNCIMSNRRTAHRMRASLGAAAFAAAIAGPLAQSAHADPVAPPRVPSTIQAPSGHSPFLVGHAVGTQNYTCKRVGPDVKFVLFTPEARLVKGDEQLTSHYFSPNPFEANSDPTVLSDHTIRPTWRHSRDTSTVWAKAVPNAASAVAPDAIPWLLLQVAGAQKGTNGGDSLTPTTFIQRINTTGGMAPSTGCTTPAEIGNQAFVPYTADYVFFKKTADADTSGRD